MAPMTPTPFQALAALSYLAVLCAPAALLVVAVLR